MGVSILKCVAIIASFFATLRAATANEGHIWTIALGHDWGAYEYVDSRGYLAGFTIDMVTAVCNAANMNCNLIWDPYTNCFESKAGQHSRGGKGLLGGWYDACSMWVKTSTRIQIFMFSDPMIPDEPGSFYVLYNYGNSGLGDMQGKNVGFFDGWSADEKCVQKAYNVKIPAANIKHVLSTPEGVAGLKNRDFDYLFATPKAMKQYIDTQEIKVANISPKMCSIAGHCMMSRKDNLFNEHFNEGLNKILANGVYRKVCANAQATHGSGAMGTIKCLDI